MKNVREYQKNIYYFTDHAEAFDCVDHNILWKILKEMGIPDHLTCLLRCLLLGRKVMTNLDSILKSRDITLSIKVRLVKAIVFPVVMYGCESWTINFESVPKN